MSDTDAGNVRSALIGNSLRQLAAIRDDIRVDYALGFFSNEFEPAIGWTALNGQVDQESERVRAVIAAQPASGGTDWQAAISGAQGALASVKSPGSCQTMLWLTDGGISVGGNTPQENSTAINALCGNAVAAGGAPPAAGSRGLFGELRQAGIVLFGIMLRDANVQDEQLQYVPYMKPLVEGEGSVPGADITCGEHPIPERHAHGVYLEATSADDLGAVFLRLATLVGGGAQFSVGADGSFPVDPGITRFALLVSGSDWSLTSPSDRVASAADATTLNLTLEQPGGSVTRINSPILGDEDFGDWRLEGAPGSSVYYFSDLRIVIDPPAAIVAGQDNEVVGRVVGAQGEPRSLTEYNFDLTLSTLTPGGSEPAPIEREDVNEEEGTFTLHYSAEQASGEVTLQAALTNITTLRSALPVADVAAELTVSVTVPENYPTVTPVPVVLSTLSGSDGRATGQFKLIAPADGSAGTVCFPEGTSATIDSDAASRADTWVWTSSVEDECVELAPQETVQVTLTAQNSVPANSSVAAHLTAEYREAKGGEISALIPITFATERPVNLGAFTSLLILLVVLGLAIPLLLLQLLNWWLTRINTGAHLSRLSERVRIGPDGAITTVDGRALADTQWGLSNWTFMSRSAPARSVVDSDLGTLRARVSPNPLGAPWYELVPRDGHRVLGAPADLPRRLEFRRQRGELLGVRGDLGHLWAISVDSAQPVGAGESVQGTLVAYLRNPSGDESAFHQRIITVSQEAERSTGAMSGWVSRASAGASEGARPPTGPSSPLSAAEPPRREARTGESADSEPPRRERDRSAGAGSGRLDPSNPPRRSPNTGGQPSPPPASGRSEPPSSSEPPRRQR